jgi:hypothetical protein
LSTIPKEIIWIASNVKISKVAQTNDIVEVFGSPSDISGFIRGEFPHAQIFMNDGSSPLK